MNKTGNRFAIGMILNGILILFTYSFDTLIPAVYKLVFGGGILITGIALVNIPRTKKIYNYFLITLILLGLTLFYTWPTKKEDIKRQGTFSVMIDNKLYEGTMMLEKGRITLQFKDADSSLEINDFRFSDKFGDDKVSMFCALTKNFRISYCSSENDIITDSREFFFDEGHYTIMFDFKREIAIDNKSLKMFLKTKNDEYEILVENILN